MEIKIIDKRLLEPGMFPQYAKPGDAGMDVRACVDDDWGMSVDPCYNNIWEARVVWQFGGLEICPGGQVLIPLGFAVNFSDKPDMALILVPRSGLGSKGLVLGNLIGIGDSGYQNQVCACVWNRSSSPITIKPMDRIAQMLFVPIIRPEFEVVEEFSTISERGQSGWGSSGLA